MLVERFYKELAGGMSVGEALAEARSALHAKRARWLHLGPDAETVDLDDWFIPHLYQVGADPVGAKRPVSTLNLAILPCAGAFPVPPSALTVL